MPGFWGKKYPVPLLKTGHPFLIAATIVTYGFWKLQDAMMDTEQWRNDPRHPEVRRKMMQAKGKVIVTFLDDDLNP